MEMPVDIAPLHDELGILVYVSAAGPWKDDVDLIHDGLLLFELNSALTEAGLVFASLGMREVPDTRAASARQASRDQAPLREAARDTPLVPPSEESVPG